MRALADVARREAGEAGAVVEQAVEVAGGHELGVGLAVHVDELREEELDPVALHPRLGLLGRRGRLERDATVDRQGVQRRHEPSRFARLASGISGVWAMPQWAG